MSQVFFENWDGVLRVATTTVLAYILVVILLRISGKRTLAKMNAFDFIVTIALGSIVGSVILNKTIPLIEGLTAIGLLVLLQYIITFITVRNKTFKTFITSNPTLLLYDGQLINSALKKERISTEEVNKSIREAGHSSLEDIFAVIIESTGDITVISKSDKSQKVSAMSDIKNF